MGFKRPLVRLQSLGPKSPSQKWLGLFIKTDFYKTNNYYEERQ